MGEENGEGPFFEITTPAKPPAAPSEEEEEDEMVRKDLQSSVCALRFDSALCMTPPTPALPSSFVSMLSQSVMFNR